MAGDTKSWLGSIFHADEGKDYPENHQDYQDLDQPDHYPFEFLFFEEIEFHFLPYME